MFPILMRPIITWDIETDGLWWESSKIWVIAWKKYGEDEVSTVISPDEGDFLNIFSIEDAIYVGHNIIDFDMPVIEKLYPVYFDTDIIDTFVLSSLLHPDRRGGHSLKRLSGGLKGEHEDWTQCSEEMIEYCKQDVVANERVLEKLLREPPIRAGGSPSDIQAAAERCTFRYRTCPEYTK